MLSIAASCNWNSFIIFHVKKVKIDISHLILFLFSVVYLLVETLIDNSNKSTHLIKETADRGSLKRIKNSIFLGHLCAYSSVYIRFFEIENILLIYFGSSMIVGGLFIRFKAIHTLGNHFTYNVTILKNHRLVKSGIYKLIRHPGYLGQLSIFIGTALFLNNWLSIFSMSLIIFPAYISRINIEEKFLEIKLTEEYILYKNTTYRLIPYIY